MIRDQSSLSAESVDPLRKTQASIRDATQEFALAMAARNIDLPSLKQAVNEMSSAEKLLVDQNAAEALGAQQRGLEQLIRARQNMRQYLSQSSSSSQCRQVDQQQQDKLRSDETKKKDQQQQLAEARQSLEKLAEEERRWADEASQACSTDVAGGTQERSEGASSSGDAAESESSSARREQLAESQQAMKQSLTKLAEQLQSLDSSSRTTERAVAQAQELQDRAVTNVRQDDGNRSMQAARQVAEQLEQLSRHLAGLNAQDLHQRMKQSQQLSERISQRQQQLQQQLNEATGKDAPEGNAESARAGSSGAAGAGGQAVSVSTSELVDEQRGTAMQMEMLAEQLDRLRADSTADESDLREELDRIQQQLPPAELVRQMQALADRLKAQEKGPSKRNDQRSASGDAERAARQSQELARELARVQAELTQPQLDELLQLEQDLAKWMERTQRNQERGEANAGAQQEWQELESRLEAVADDADPLAKSLRALRDPSPSSSSSSSRLTESQDSGPTTSGDRSTGSTVSGNTTSGAGQQDQSGGISPEEVAGERRPSGFGSRNGLPTGGALRGISKALQAKIQEVILAGSVLDMDQPIPAEYRPLVDEYYRTLSDDLQ